MMHNLAFIKHRLQLQTRGSMGAGSSIIVHWIETAGGTLDAVTGAWVGGVQTPTSGVMRGFGYEAEARSVLRQHAEIQTGDVIFDVDPEGTIERADGSTVLLDMLRGKGVRFEWGGRMYAQAEVGEELAAAWSLIIADQKMHRTLLLRRAT